MTACLTHSFWDTANPYHYLWTEPHRDHRLVIFGGEDHKTGVGHEQTLCASRRGALGGALGIAISHRWSGQVIETPDPTADIGKMADHRQRNRLWNGMTFGTLS